MYVANLQPCDSCSTEQLLSIWSLGELRERNDTHSAASLLYRGS
eukprot:COSAG02_NODE_142_length_34188_cov_183.180791_29_plen_43_part_01